VGARGAARAATELFDREASLPVAQAVGGFALPRVAVGRLEKCGPMAIRGLSHTKVGRRCSNSCSLYGW